MGSITVCLARNIKVLRKQRGLTQGALAERAGISVIFLQGIECEKKWLSPATVAALARALEVPQSTLFREESTPNKNSKKLKRTTSALTHIPDDIFYALSTTCRHPSWKWDTIRWIFSGFDRSNP